MEEAKRRSPVVSFLLSLCLPGLGQWYNGNILRGALLYAGMWTIFIGLGLTGLIYSLPGWICIAAVPSISWIVIAADAAIGAARLKAIQLKWYNKWYLYAGAFLFAHVALIPATAWLAQYHIVRVRTFKVPMNSMNPSLKAGDHFIAKLGRYNPTRGDAVIFPVPEDKSKTFVKRVIGLPGERLEIKDKVVFINGQRIEDPWGVYSEVTIPGQMAPRDNFGPITIPQGAVFVMGDNRDYSHDSRFWGPVEIKNITARALFIYWADDKSRIGKQLQ